MADGIFVHMDADRQEIHRKMKDSMGRCSWADYMDRLAVLAQRQIESGGL